MQRAHWPPAATARHRPHSPEYFTVGAAAAAFNADFDQLVANAMLSRLLSRASLQQRAFSAAPANAVLLERAAVQSRLTAVLQSQPFVDASKLAPNASFYHDLGLDELHAVHIAAAVQGEFCVEVPAGNAGTVDSLVTFLASHPLAK